MSGTLLLLILLVVVSYGIQTASGFGAGVVLVTLGVHFVDLSTLLALTLPLSLMQTSWVTVRNRKSVNTAVLARRVVPFMGTGVGIGFLVSGYFDDASLLKRVLGGLVFVLAARELWAVLRSAREVHSDGSSWVSVVALVGAGVVHGIYATGGPLLVFALGREGLDRETFRATVTSVWLVFNLGLVAAFAIEGRYDEGLLRQLGVLALALPVGIVAGERVFARVNERTFKLGIYGLLGLAGVPLLLG